MKCFDELIGVTQWGSLLENMASIIPPTPAGLGQGQASEAVSCVKIYHHSNRNLVNFHKNSKPMLKSYDVG